jgi:hypothetical protein
MTTAILSNNNNNNIKKRYPKNSVLLSWERLSSLKNDEEIKLTESYIDVSNDNNNNNTAVVDWFTRMGTQSQQPKETRGSLPSMVPLDETQTNVAENWVDESKHVELLGLIAWMASISAFILMNNFVGPFPEFFRHVHERFFFLGHMMGGMLFGGE